MKWNAIRKQYPNSWILLEATAAHSANKKRILDELKVIEVYGDSPTALERYKNEHNLNPLRELFVLHTSREIIDVEERRWVGIRA